MNPDQSARAELCKILNNEMTEEVMNACINILETNCDPETLSLIYSELKKYFI